MKKYNFKKNIMVILIVTIFLTLNIQVLSENITKESKLEEERVIIKIGTDEYGLDATYIEITFTQTQRIIEN